MDNQEFFDKTVQHLRKQGCVATNGWTCRYRAVRNDGTVLMCAIGCHIPDKLYKPRMEEKNIDVLRGMFPELHQLFKHVSPMLMNRCQSAHDGMNWCDFIHFQINIEDRFAAIAKEFYLTMPKREDACAAI